MLTFKEFIAEEAKAKAYMDDLYEQAAQTTRREKFVLTEEQQQKAAAILKMFPDILKRSKPEHVQHLGSKRKPGLSHYDSRHDKKGR